MRRGLPLGAIDGNDTILFNHLELNVQVRRAAAGPPHESAPESDARDTTALPATYSLLNSGGLPAQACPPWPAIARGDRWPRMQPCVMRGPQSRGPAATRIASVCRCTIGQTR